MYTLGLLGLLSLPILVGIYFFRIRYPEKKISSLFLWDFPETRLSRGMQKNKFINERSFWLELLALLLIILLLLKVDSLFPSQDKHVVYVLDNRFSMQAKVNGNEIYKGIVEEIQNEIRNSFHKVTILIADESPKILASSTDEALEYLKSWKPNGVTFDWFATKELLREMTSVKSEIIVYSDRPVPFDDFERIVDVRLKGESLGNGYLLSAFVERKETGFTLGVFAGYSGTSPAQLKATVQIDSKQHELVLSKKNEELFYGEIPVGSEHVVASIVLEDDALLVDNYFHLIPEKKKIWRVQVELNDERLSKEVRRVLAIFPNVSLVVKNADCVVSDHGVLDVQLPHILLGISDKKTKHVSADFTGQYISESGHPLLSDLDLSDMVVFGVEKSAESIYPLVHKNGFVIFGLLKNYKCETYFWNIDFNKTDLYSRYMWPLFWENTLTYFSKDLEGLAKTNVLTGEVNSYFSKNAMAMNVIDPLGAKVAISGLPKKHTFIPPAGMPGVYKLMDGEKEVASYQCNLMDPNGSYLLSSVNEELKLGNSIYEDAFLRSLHEGNSLFILIVVLFMLAIYLLNLYLDYKREGQSDGI